jgi:hypothetical protein
VKQLYADKYPALSFLLSLSETKLVPDQAVETDLPSVDILYHFGIAHGKRFLNLEEWLAENTTRRLIYLDDRLDPFAALHETAHAERLINHAQVELHHVQNWEESLDHFAALYPTPGIAIEVPPHFAAQKESLQKKTWLTYNLSIDVTKADGLFANITANIKRLPHTFSTPRLKNRFRNIPAIICGAGPSLTTDLDPMRHLIIAGGSAIPILSKRGIEPHFTIAFDPNPEEHARLKQTDNFSTPLLFGARLNPAAIDLCNPPLGYIPSNTAGFACDYLERELGIKENLLSGLDEGAQTVTAAAIAMASHFGCDPIILSGVDLSYKDGAQYAPGILESGAQMRRTGPMGDPLIKSGDLYTSLVWQLEAATLAAFAKNHPGTILNLSTGLDITNIPRIEKIPQSIQRDLYGAVHAALRYTHTLDPAPALSKLKKSIVKTLHLLIKFQIATEREKIVIEWELEDECAYTCFVKPLALFATENDLVEKAILLLKKTVSL